MTDERLTREQRFRAWRKLGFGVDEAWRRADMPDIDPPAQTPCMRSAEATAQEMAEGMRRRFGHDMRHPAGVAWLAACIMEVRHEMALDLGISNAPRPGPEDAWRLNRDD